MKKKYLPPLLSQNNWEKRSKAAEKWFKSLRNHFCKEFLNLENQYNEERNFKKTSFKKKKWNKDNSEDFGGGVSNILSGNLFEKVGVNISTVTGIFPDKFKNSIKGASKDPRFFATGISVVSHMKSPFIPAAHFNSRLIITKNGWFGGGCDLTPAYQINKIREDFHKNLKIFCDNYNVNYYNTFSKLCKNYFFLKHRNEERGVGGIFFDYLQNNWEKDFEFVKGTGLFFLKYYKKIILKNQAKSWTEKNRKKLLLKRGRYVEFNLLYDKGTTFGLNTGGNTDAILMSMPPKVLWN
ncbi:MAG: oxygen-dependent coproporphyrinogen oxidase [Pelagibacterales bacterium]|nr:oxygen-dependent coproporphyrinogen oxidase [Pelagibacterales bacterium]|tara:strand:+ start:167 stop:1051 length:885 start_codon:yes stop_codon:yes gene_type:complete